MNILTYFCKKKMKLSSPPCRTRTFRLLTVSTILILIYHNELVKSDGEEGWSNNTVDDVAKDHSTEASNNVEDGKNENPVPTEHTNNVGVSPPQDGGQNGEQGPSGMANTVNEPSDGDGQSEIPLQTFSQAPGEQDLTNDEQHRTESTLTEAPDDAEHQHPTSSDQWSSGATTEGDGHEWSNKSDPNGNKSTDSGLSGATPSISSSDEQGQNHGQTEGSGTETPPGADRWNNTEESHEHSSTESSDSLASSNNRSEHTNSLEQDVMTATTSVGSTEFQGAVSDTGNTEYGDSRTTSLGDQGFTTTSSPRGEMVSCTTAPMGGSTIPYHPRGTVDYTGTYASGNVGITTPIGFDQPTPAYVTRTTDSNGGSTNPFRGRRTTNEDGAGTTPGDGRGQDDSGMRSTSGYENGENVESGTPVYSEGSTTGDDRGVTTSADYSWRDDGQGPTTSSYDGISDSPPHYDDPQFDGQSPAPDYDLVTLGTDYGEIPEDEPDKEGNELVESCKKESNYQGDFQDPNESSTELKCFYACALLRMEVMSEENGQIQLNMQTTENMIEDAFGDNTVMIEKYKNAATTCDQEVQKGGDRCEYVFNFINCGIQKVQSR